MNDAAPGAPWYLRLGAWIGVGTAPGALMAGGGIAASTEGPWTVPAVSLGVMGVVTLAVLIGHQGYRRRSTTMSLARRAFGGGGERSVAVLIALGVCGWSGLYVGVCAGAFHQLWGWSPLLTAPVFGVALWFCYRAGFARWNVMVGLTGLASMGVATLVARGVETDIVASAPPRADGLAALVLGFGMVIAYATAFALRSADFTWDARRGVDVLVAGAVLAVAMLAFMLLGVMIYSRAGSFDLSTLVNQTTTPELGALLLVLAAIAPAVSGVHSGTLSVRRLTGWPPARCAALIASTMAALGALRVDLHLLTFLGLLGAVLPQLIGVILVRGNRNRDWHAWAGWAAGSSMSLALLAVGYPAHVLLGVATAAATVLSLGLVSPARRQKGAPCSAT